MDGVMLAYGAKAFSAGQREYTARRVAQLAEQRKQRLLLEQQQALDFSPLTSPLSTGSNNNPFDDWRSNDDMTGSRQGVSLTKLTGEYQRSLFRNPYELRHGRRFLRDLPYPLPADLPEIHRQNLRTLLACRAFGRAVCSIRTENDIPQRVLDVGCGSGYWSALCHDYFSSLGHEGVSFTGVDFAPLAPDLNEQGLDWTFVRHDIRRCPMPFDDGAFDLVMCKDLSLVASIGGMRQSLIEDCIRVLRPGGILEIWDADHVIRSLTPHPPPAPDRYPNDPAHAAKTGTYILTPETIFSPSQNKYLQQANAWILEGLETRRLPSSPCARISRELFQEASVADIFSRRIAIPLGEMRWEPERISSQGPMDSPMSKGKRRVVSTDEEDLAEQAALRQTALATVVQEIESLEVLVREVNGKTPGEWGHWWSSMMSDLLDPSRCSLDGECLEIGAWWARKQEPGR